MTMFSSCKRNITLQKLVENHLDVLVIGGGITGAGIALDASQRGLRTGLIDMQDFAAGTSSRSTKLIHGGLRYLKQLEVSLVAEVGKERRIVYENGPHVTTPEWMMLPFYKGGTFGPFVTSLALRLYDFLARVKKAERRKMLSMTETVEKEPLLVQKNLRGAGYYVEYKTDDARLTLEVLKKAVEIGALAINYVKVTTFLYDKSKKITGVIIQDQISEKTYKVYAKQVINATGPWVDKLIEKDGSKNEKNLILTKGVHLVFSHKHFPLRQAIYFDTPDKRMIFAIPRGNKTYVGTTDTLYKGDIVHPQVTEDDLYYLLHAINSMFPSLQLTKESIESNWVGLRPLIAEKGKNPNEISRKDEVFLSESGLYSIAGGKLTGYRKMAEQVMDAVVAQFKKEEEIIYSDSHTINLPISGGDVGGSKGFQAYKEKMMQTSLKIGLVQKEAYELIQTYGSNAQIVFKIYEDNKQFAAKERINPVVLATLIYAIDYESAYKPVDYFIRRTGAMFFDVDFVDKHKQSVIRFMEKMLNWTNEQTKLYSDELDERLNEAVLNKTN